MALNSVSGSGSVDVLHEDGERQTLFNDDKAQHLTSEEYDARLAAGDSRYARLLTVLTSAVNQIPQSTTGVAK